MFYLDGMVENLILVPSGSCSRLISNILRHVKIEAVIVDESVDRSAWPDGTTLTLAGDAAEAEPAALHEELETQWMISTSGTTGPAKLITHSLRSLCRTVTRKQEHASQTWGLLYDPSRFAGLQVTLQAMISGASLVITDTRDKLDHRIDQMVSQGISALSATPTLWKRLLMTEHFNSVRLRQITLSGEIVEEKLINALAAKFPDSHITHIYASTEAGVGFAVHDGKEGFPLSWIDRPSREQKLSISAQNTLLIRSTENKQTYANQPAHIYNDRGWHDTGDIVKIASDRVVFRGRLNGSINVGGNKVMPEEVERHIEKLSIIQKAVVRAQKSSIVGNLLNASLVLTPDATRSKDVINMVRTHCSESLASYKVPAFIKIVDDIPMTASGKIERE